jgi:hypothetical protein
MLPKNVFYYGVDKGLPERRTLRAGPLSVAFEAGDLRTIRLGDHEILRRVYVAIRDRTWGTVPAVLSHLRVDDDGSSFQISFEAQNQQNEIDFVWQAVICGDRRGTITFSMDGRARSTFWRNRIGFCILHPLECAGIPCRIEHVDGSAEDSSFPRGIAPQFIRDGIVKPVHPFENMRAVSHEVVPGVRARVGFEGDVFELEDQRNWTDASFKIYSTPLNLPYPVEIREGTAICQSMTLTLEGLVPVDPVAVRERELVFAVGVDLAPVGPLPRIGLGVAGHGQPLSQKELGRLEALNLAHLRTDLDLSVPGYEAVLRRATSEAEALGVPLEVALWLSDAAADQLRAFRAVLEPMGPEVCTWLVFHQAEESTAEPWVRLARQYLADYDGRAKIGAGTHAFFTELNRGRPPLSALDLVCYSIIPQVHAFDNTSLVETLAVQAMTVENARRFCGDLPLAISPVTLRKHPGRTAARTAQGREGGGLPAHVDVRQMSLFGAGWTAGSLKYLAESGAWSVTYYETSGWCGVMETEAGSPLPDRFRSLPGSVFPVYHVLADVGEFAHGQIVPTRSTDRLKIEGLAVERDGRRRVVVANLSAESLHLEVRGLSEQVRVRRLDETNVERAMLAPEAFRLQEGQPALTSGGTLGLDLLPYALVRIDTSRSPAAE